MTKASIASLIGHITVTPVTANRETIVIVLTHNVHGDASTWPFVTQPGYKDQLLDNLRRTVPGWRNHAELSIDIVRPITFEHQTRPFMLLDFNNQLWHMRTCAPSQSSTPPRPIVDTDDFMYLLGGTVAVRIGHQHQTWLLAEDTIIDNNPVSLSVIQRLRNRASTMLHPTRAAPVVHLTTFTPDMWRYARANMNTVSIMTDRGETLRADSIDDPDTKLGTYELTSAQTN